ncbi:hypothetical protein DFH08DRAFT_971724 [Mycena albidolilacea]|uniref:Uncharacterized protein n=1 Tax=Mycena albidolilacea TaxID=1033008 RepID=A0AAD7EEA0_9AGAR|nr:hypothetical protein DFH08DRAFT_971724 [Mycena albidolilacea]
MIGSAPGGPVDIRRVAKSIDGAAVPHPSAKAAPSICWLRLHTAAACGLQHAQRRLTTACPCHSLGACAARSSLPFINPYSLLALLHLFTPNSPLFPSPSPPSLAPPGSLSCPPSLFISSLVAKIPPIRLSRTLPVFRRASGRRAALFFWLALTSAMSVGRSTCSDLESHPAHTGPRLLSALLLLSSFPLPHPTLHILALH